MRVTISDLRYRIKEAMHALDENQSVTIFYRGKVKAMIVPVNSIKTETVRNSPLFGMYAADATASGAMTLDPKMRCLRGARY